MASVQFGGGVSQIRGSIAGSVFSRNANGAYIRSRTAPANPNSPKQQAQRAVFGAQARAWRDLSEDQKNTWINQTEAYPYVNRMGETDIYTAFQLFVKQNSILSAADQNTIANLPAPIALPAITSLEVTEASSGTVECAVQINYMDEVPTGFVLVIEATALKSLGTYRTKRPDYKFMTVVPGLEMTMAIDISSQWIATYGFLTPNSKLFIRAFLVAQATGQSSEAVSNFLVSA